MKRDNMSNKITIDFLGIGVTKAATTWIAQCLAEHPDIYVPKKKEVFYFAYEKNGGFYERGENWYAKHFKKAKEYQLKGEFTTQYMLHKESAKLIKKHNPNVKILACLRNPADMIYSLYWWKRANFEAPDYIINFDEHIKKNPKMLERGKYYQQLKNYYDTFPKENILVLLHEEVKKNPDKIVKKVYDYVGVDKNYIPEALNKSINISKTYKSLAFAKVVNSSINLLKSIGAQRFVQSLISSKTASNIYTKINKKPVTYPKMSAETRKYLNDYYKSDVMKLEKLLNKDLSAWYQI